jgi:hypothetical protein
MTWLSELVATSLVIWLYLLLGQDACGRARPRIEDEAPPEPGSWPAVSLTEQDCLAWARPTMVGKPSCGVYNP